MHTSFNLGQAARVAVVSLIAGAAGLGLQAQQTAAPNFQATLKTPANPFLTDSSLSASADSSSSSSSIATDPVTAEHLSLSSTSDSLQPPPRRRYGRPRYTDSSHNPDGSNKYTFEFGAGLTLPTGGTHNALSPSYNFQVGAGRNFNKNFATLIQFDWANFGVQTNTLNNLLTIYNNAGAVDQNGNPLSQLNGSSHDWSLTVDPMYTLTGDKALGAYVIGGAGFYHKTASFTIPGVGAEETLFGVEEFEENLSLDKYTSNAFGVNGGVGLTYKFSRFANERFFAEARYVYNFNQRRPYYDGTTGTSLSSTYFNVFPQNSAPTTFIPITVGIRF